jgi:hypothetical protein
MSTCGEGLSPPEDRLAVSWPAVFLTVRWGDEAGDPQLPTSCGGNEMKQIKRAISRIIHITATACALALLGTTLFFWPRSFRVEDEWRRNEYVNEADEEFTSKLYSCRGTIAWIRSGAVPMIATNTGPRIVWWHFEWVPEFEFAEACFEAPTRTQRAGFIFARARPRPATFNEGIPLKRPAPPVIALPHWFVAALSAVASYAGVRRIVFAWRRRVRQHCGHCPACDYDLRATPDRCPECGAVPTMK